MDTRDPYPSDVGDDEWAFVAPYLALVREDAPQRDTLGHLLALVATPADAHDRAQVAELSRRVQEATGDSVEVAFVDQGYTGAEPAAAAAALGVRLEVVKLP